MTSSLFAKTKAKIQGLFSAADSSEEMSRDDTVYYSKDLRARIESWFVHQTTVIRDISEIKFEELTRKYNNAENIKRYIEILEEVEKEFEETKPKSAIQKAKQTISSGATKVASVFKRKSKKQKQ